MLDTFWVMVIPNAMAAYQMIVARTYFVTNIPRDLYETSQLEGCSDFRFLGTIVIPLSKALIAVLVLLYAVGHWNSYFHAMIYLKDPARAPLQIVLREILLQNTIDYTDMNSIENSLRQDDMYELIKYVLIVVSSAPILALYPFVQKYFVKGVMVGSIKG
jgi:putative aldouronate transport system permease protein